MSSDAPKSTLTEPVSSRNHTFFRLVREFAPYRREIAVVLCLGLVIAAIQPASVRLSQLIIDELQGKAQSGFFRWLPWLVIGVFLVSGLAKYFHNTIRRVLAERVLAKLRERLFEKFCRMPLVQVDSTRSGELLSHIQNDLTQIGGGIDMLAVLLKEPFTFVGLMGVAFYCDWVLTLITLVVAPLVALLFSRSGVAVKRYSERNLGQFGRLMAISQESLTGARVVKVFGLEVPLLDKFRHIHRDYLRTLSKSIRVQELGTPVVELIGAMLMAGVVWYGGQRVAAGHLTTGELIAFIIAIGISQMPLKQLNNCFLKLKNAEAAADRIYALLDRELGSERSSGRVVKRNFEREIEFRDVGLKYGDKWALRGISFSIKRGECAAFVGQSGGGKSSVVNLLPRLYSPSEGKILIDGVSLDDFALTDLRSLFSFVTQDTFLFHDSILENIRMGRPDATRAEIERVAELAHCSDFVARAPQGFDTIIGDRGVCLSGGERQRLAIARAFLRNAPILILDEATSSLDSAAEAVVQDALGELMSGKTTLVVAHRFSTVRHADRIFVMSDGRIVQSGTHQELQGIEGQYKLLLERQIGWGDATVS